MFMAVYLYVHHRHEKMFGFLCLVKKRETERARAEVKEQEYC